jgi:hypothetical protein
MKANYLQLFEKYSNGEMSPSEEAAFTQQLQEDPAMQHDFKEYQQIIEALDDPEMLNLRLKLRKIREEESVKRNRYPFLNSGNNWVWLAALLTIIAGFTITITLLVTNYSDRRHDPLTYVDYFEQKARESLNEELMKYGTRKGGMHLVTPSDSAYFFVEGPVLFEWTVDSTYNMLMDVLDYRGKVVFKSYRPIQSPFLFTRELKTGMYIFRFRDNTGTYNLVSLYLI